MKTYIYLVSYRLYGTKDAYGDAVIGREQKVNDVKRIKELKKDILEGLGLQEPKDGLILINLKLLDTQGEE